MNTCNAPLFPRGLFQPENSFKFSSDALLLAAFSSSTLKAVKVLDLGAGCGVVGFSLLLRHPEITVTAVEIQPELATISYHNAVNLCIEKRFTVICYDVKKLFQAKNLKKVKEDTPHILDNKEIKKEKVLSEPSSLLPESFDLVVANPPYYVRGHGRDSKHRTRSHALFGEEKTLANFCSVASRALKPKGSFCMIFTASRLSELLACCKESNLGVRRILCIHARKNQKAERILVEAKKGAKNDISIDPPLFLYEGKELSSAAKNFCPELC